MSVPLTPLLAKVAPRDSPVSMLYRGTRRRGIMTYADAFHVCVTWATGQKGVLYFSRTAVPNAFALQLEEDTL